MSLGGGVYSRSLNGLAAGDFVSELRVGAAVAATASGQPQDEMMAAMCEGVGEASLRLKELEELALVLDGGPGARRPPPRTIECYDVSHLYGSYTVAASSAATCGVLDLDRYGCYPLGPDCGVPPADDCAALRAALRIRFGKGPGGAAEVEAGVGAAGSGAWCDPVDVPDLIVIDGGKPQLGAAMAVLDEVSWASFRFGWVGGRGVVETGSSGGRGGAHALRRQAPPPTALVPASPNPALLLPCYLCTASAPIPLLPPPHTTPGTRSRLPP